MSTISKEDVLSLREKTGAGLIDCKRALAESNGDVEEAISILRKKGLLQLPKRQAEMQERVLLHKLSPMMAQKEFWLK